MCVLKNQKGYPATVTRKSCHAQASSDAHMKHLFAQYMHTRGKQDAKISSTSSHKVIIVCSEVHCCIIMTTNDKQIKKSVCVSNIAYTHEVMNGINLFAQEVEKEQERKNEKGDAEADAHGIDISEDLENDLCRLWDMSTNMVRITHFDSNSIV